MNCIPTLSGFVLSEDYNYYRDLLFDQILKDKIITEDSFDKLYFIAKNYKITGISDSKGNLSWEVKTNMFGYKEVDLSDEKKYQLKVDFSSNIMDSAIILVDYKLK